ncbi:hypothetical protein TrRE_jg3423, partial [Triparma retinervis]
EAISKAKKGVKHSAQHNEAIRTWWDEDTSDTEYMPGGAKYPEDMEGENLTNRKVRILWWDEDTSITEYM